MGTRPENPMECDKAFRRPEDGTVYCGIPSVFCNCSYFSRFPSTSLRYPNGECVNYGTCENSSVRASMRPGTEIISITLRAEDKESAIGKPGARLPS